MGARKYQIYFRTDVYDITICYLYDIIMLHMSLLFCLLTLLTISDKYI